VKLTVNGAPQLAVDPIVKAAFGFVVILIKESFVNEALQP
jgi:hypothetical protein